MISFNQPPLCIQAVSVLHTSIILCQLLMGKMSVGHGVSIAKELGTYLYVLVCDYQCIRIQARQICPSLLVSTMMVNLTAIKQVHNKQMLDMYNFQMPDFTSCTGHLFGSLEFLPLFVFDISNIFVSLSIGCKENSLEYCL